MEVDSRPPGSGTTTRRRYGILDEQKTSGVSETIWLQPPIDRSHVSTRRPDTLALPNQILLPHIVDDLASTAKSPDLKALIRYVGRQDDPWNTTSANDGHMIALQHCVRDATRRMTYFINAVNAVPETDDAAASSMTSSSGDAGRSKRLGGGGKGDDDDFGFEYDALAVDDDDPTARRRSRRRRQVRVISAARLHRQLRAQCRAVSDDVLPALVDALRAATWPPMTTISGPYDDFQGVRLQLALVDETIVALQPCVQMVVIARRLLDEIDDLELVTNLTSLVLAVAESLLRMRLASSRSLVELPFSVADKRSPYDNFEDLTGISGDSNPLRRDESADQMALSVYRNAEMTSGLPLASMELCDAAYRQIQRAGTSLECCYWPPVSDDDHLANLLATVVSSCYDIGTSMDAICQSAQCRQMPTFHQSVRRFADAVCRVMITTAQIGLSRPSLEMAAKAIRHCACSLVTSARMLACDGQHAGSYGTYAAHSRALSRALTELVNCLSWQYVSCRPCRVDAPVRRLVPNGRTIRLRC